MAVKSCFYVSYFSHLCLFCPSFAFPLLLYISKPKSYPHVERHLFLVLIEHLVLRISSETGQEHTSMRALWLGRLVLSEYVSKSEAYQGSPLTELGVVFVPPANLIRIFGAWVWATSPGRQRHGNRFPRIPSKSPSESPYPSDILLRLHLWGTSTSPLPPFTPDVSLHSKDLVAPETQKQDAALSNKQFSKSHHLGPTALNGTSQLAKLHHGTQAQSHQRFLKDGSHRTLHFNWRSINSPLLECSRSASCTCCQDEVPKWSPKAISPWTL